ncbi:MAG: hypothetical protein JHD16_17285 [Solirubrobacteraceae bacterium]|nr:hypothetical protein [Solirubrobacteraceae bacterium]
MSSETISPRGIPPIRPDWLVDVAWRLADLGLDHLSSWSENGLYTLEDVVDGERWRFGSVRLSGHLATSVEHDADLFLPTDTTQATLRVGFQFTPWWDEAMGRCVQTRIEVGPRGPVTFDPENWFVLLPLPGAATSRPAVSGLQAGEWDTGGQGDPAPDPATAEELAGTALMIEELRLVSADRRVPELSLPAHALGRKGGVIGRNRLVPSGVARYRARLQADGPIEANWTGVASLSEMVEVGFWGIASVETGDDHCTFRGAGNDGVLTLTGPRLRLTVDAPFTP